MSRVKVTDEMLIEAVKSSVSYREVVRKLGKKLAGGTQSHYKRKILSLKLDTSHFLGQSIKKGVVSCNKKSAKDILIKRETGGRAKSYLLRRALIEIGVKYECSKCGNDGNWMGNRLTLDVDHLNGDWLDDRPENLRFLCPNCHSQYSRNIIK